MRREHKKTEGHFLGVTFSVQCKSLYYIYQHDHYVTIIIFASVSSFFRRTQTIRFTPYIEECATSLAENPEHPNDGLAAALVRLQIIAEKIYQSPWHHKTSSPAIPPVTMFIVSSLKEQLKHFHDGLSYELKQNGRLSDQFA